MPTSATSASVFTALAVAHEPAACVPPRSTTGSGLQWMLGLSAPTSGATDSSGSEDSTGTWPEACDSDQENSPCSSDTSESIVSEPVLNNRMMPIKCTNCAAKFFVLEEPLEEPQVVRSPSMPRRELSPKHVGKPARASARGYCSGECFFTHQVRPRQSPR